MSECQIMSKCQIMAKCQIVSKCQNMSDGELYHKCHSKIKIWLILKFETAVMVFQ